MSSPVIFTDVVSVLHFRLGNLLLQFGSIADRAFSRLLRIAINSRSGNAIHLGVRHLDRSNLDGAELIVCWSGGLRNRCCRLRRFCDEVI